ncbi:unnamed protein product [Owenia fusiformis]|uniref:Uncharacterized protein n=1 Tax=Owenia fusiformis TaxID=6347 RepID=A0A8J1T795_OWEFU|nr:unnamed protein product [Owenia fusiformis]
MEETSRFGGLHPQMDNIAVRAACTIPKGSTTAPYPGPCTIGLRTSDLRVVHYVIEARSVNGEILADAERTRDWMLYVLPARDNLEQNLEAVKHISGHILFRAIREVKTGELLSVWYSEELAQEMAIPNLQKQHSTDNRKFNCLSCDKTYDYPNSLRAHIRYRCIAHSQIPKIPMQPTVLKTPTAHNDHLRRIGVLGTDGNTQLTKPEPVSPNSVSSMSPNHMPLNFSTKSAFKRLKTEDVKLDQDSSVSDANRAPIGGPPGSTQSELEVPHMSPFVEPLYRYYYYSLYPHLYQRYMVDHFEANKQTRGRPVYRPCKNDNFPTMPTPAVGMRDEDQFMADRQIPEANASFSQDAVTLPYRFPLPSDKHEPLDLLPRSLYVSKSRKGHLCIYCGKLYSRKYGLKIHLRTHTGYKPLKCKVCFRPFGDPSNLNKHIRLHAEGDTPYRCDHCGKVLVRRRDLERHIKSRHPDANFISEDVNSKGVYNVSNATDDNTAVNKISICENTFGIDIEGDDRDAEIEVV